jgi:hypothetical protein
MKFVSVGLVCAFVLTGCVTPSAPITGLEAQVFKVVMDDAFAVATAEQLARDCPRLGFDEALSKRVGAKTAAKVIDMFDGDLVRAERLLTIMKRRVDSGSEPEADRRILAYLQANNYIPGDTEAACRTGEKERRNGSAIGQMLFKQ